MKKAKEILRKIFKGILTGFDIFISELLVQIIAPILYAILWIIMLPVKLVFIIIKCDKLTMDYEEAKNIVNGFKEIHPIAHYSLTYLMLKCKLGFCDKFGFAI